MKKKKKHKQAQKSQLLHWIGFFVCLVAITSFTAYGFLLSLRPTSLILNAAPDESSLALVGVAMANNIGTGQSRANDIPVQLPEDVQTVQDALQDTTLEGSDFFQKHFIFLQEFDEILSIDIVNYLSLHEEKSDAFDAYIGTLSDKLADAENRYDALVDQTLFHENTFTGFESDIKAAQTNINTAYTNRESQSMMDGFIHLEELIIQYQDNKNNATFDKKLAQEYGVLIQNARAKLTVLTANKDALVKGVTVSLPAGTNVKALEDLNIFSKQAQ